MVVAVVEIWHIRSDLDDPAMPVAVTVTSEGVESLSLVVVILAVGVLVQTA